MKTLLAFALLVCVAQGEINYDDILFGTQYGLQNYYNSLPVPSSVSIPSPTSDPLQDITTSPMPSHYEYQVSTIATDFSNMQNAGYSVATVADRLLEPLNGLPTSLSPMTSYSLGHFSFASHSFDFTINFAPYADGISIFRTAVLCVMICGFAFTVASTMRGYL